MHLKYADLDHPIQRPRPANFHKPLGSTVIYEGSFLDPVHLLLATNRAAITCAL